MVKNSITFNGEDSAYSQTAIAIRKEILKVLNASDKLLIKFDPKVQ